TDATGTVAWVSRDSFESIADQVTITGIGTAADPFKVEDLSIVTAKLGPDAVTNAKLADDAVQLENIADGTASGQVIQWNGTDWVLIDLSSVTVTEIDGIIGNEVVNGTDATLTRSGAGTTGDPFTLDIAADGITNAELADNAVQLENVADGTAVGQIMQWNGTDWILVDGSVLDTDTQDISSSVVTPNETVRIALVDGGTTDIDIRDADAVTGNEVVNGTDATLTRSGTGTSGDPFTLDVAADGITNAEIADDAVQLENIANGTATGQVIQWDGTDWTLVDLGSVTVTENDGVIGNEVVNGTDGTLVRSGAGSTVSPYTLDVAADGITNAELADNAVQLENVADGTAVGQIMQWNGTDWVLIDGNGLSTDDQTVDGLTFNAGTGELGISLEDDGAAPVTVDLSALDTDTDDQTVDGLTFNAGTGELAISLEDDGAAPVTVDISGVSTDDQTVDALTFNAGTGELGISLEDDGAAPVTVDLSALDTDTDDQTVDGLTFNAGTGELAISLEDDGAAPVTVDISGVSTDDQTVDGLTFNAGTGELAISLEDDGAAPVTVDLSALDTDTDDQTVDGLTFNAGTGELAISLEDDGAAPVTVDISGVSTDDQTVDGLTFNAGTGELGISLEDDGAAPVTVDISALDTDDQTVDALTFNAGTGELGISLEDDGAAPVTVDLSALDTDNQTLSTDGTAGDISISGGNDITLNVDDADAIIGNEVVNGTDATLTRSGAGTTGDPFTLDVAADGITNAEIADDAVQLENIANGTTTGQVIQWDGTDWVLIDLSSVTVTEVDGVIGNEVVNGTDATLTRSGAGTAGDPFTLDVAADGITNAELADNAVQLENVADGTAVGQIMQWNGTDWVLIDGNGLSTDDQTVDGLTFNAGTGELGISLEDDGAAPATVDLSALDTDTDDQTVDGLTFNAGTGELAISLEDDGAAPVTVDLSALDTDTDDQTVDGLTFNAGTGELAISLEDDGAAPVTVDISGVSTDDQTVDALTFNSGTNELAISLEDDGAAPVTVDLSDLDTNIYNSDGTLTANRAVTQGAFDLNFDANTLVVSGDDNRVGIGTDSPSTELDVNGSARVRTLPASADTDELVTADANGNLRQVNSLRASKVFYPPSIEIDASTNGTFSIDLYAQYIAQFGSPVVSSGGTIPTYLASELDYHVTLADPSVFNTGTMSITPAGVLTYTIIGQPADYNSLINVVFVVK
ncbi:beta strand repeat-containing protein, partial [Maribacter sp.]